MTWHLKDRELEKKILEIDPDFVKTLTEVVETNLKATNGRFNHESTVGIALEINNETGATFRFFIDTLENVSEYNPHAWNEYPKVTPPFDKDMRVELDDGLRYCARYHKFSDGCFWVGTNGTCFPKYLNDKVVRFRPWED